ncbi:MAG: MarR family transcriptional regulator [Eggerthellaceae bacterium]|nr:MarR family transcriptional regulator [Eggerthellaceae bacterium]
MVEIDDRYASLKIENQICFPLYVCSKEVVRRYKPFLDQLDLTYTQYITMLALWEKGQASVNELGERLYLDSGTLTPLLKKLETKGYVARTRCSTDERKVIISLTEKGAELKERALEVPGNVSRCVELDSDEAVLLHGLLHKLIEALKQ